MISLSALDNLLAVEPLLLATTSGAVDGYRTPTSDMDYFAICADDVAASVRGALVRVQRLDLEIQDLGWFDQIEAKLTEHAVSISGGVSPFSYLDLRFLGRIALATPLVETGDLAERLRRLRDPVRVAASELVSSRFVSLFEDAVGFILAGLPNSVRLIAGELVQNGCLLALLQTELVDIAPKWAPARCVGNQHQKLSESSSRLLDHLAESPVGGQTVWATELLHGLNAVIANGLCAARGWPVSDAEAGGRADRAAIPWCLMGVAGYGSFADVEHNRILVGSAELIMAMAGGAPATSAPILQIEAIG